jgi:DNA-binding NarL/FixJ family response regulator
MTDQASPRVRIVLADDEPVILEALRQLLEELGYDVVGTAADGGKAVELAEQLLPDVMVVDLRMPVLTGIEVASVLGISCPTLPVIVLSAYDDAGLQLAAERVPVSAYLVKGCSSREIVGAIRDAVSAVGSVR